MQASPPDSLTCTAATARRSSTCLQVDSGELIPVGEARELSLEELTPADRAALIKAATAAQEALA